MYEKELKTLNQRRLIAPVVFALPLSLLALSGCSSATQVDPTEFIQGSWTCQEDNAGAFEQMRELKFKITDDKITLDLWEVRAPGDTQTVQYDYTINGTTLTTTPVDGGSGWKIELPETVQMTDAPNEAAIVEGWPQAVEVVATPDTAEWSLHDGKLSYLCGRDGSGKEPHPSLDDEPDSKTAPDATHSSSNIEVGELYNPNSVDFIPVPSYVGDYRLVNYKLIEEEGLACSDYHLFQSEPYGRGRETTYLYANADGIEELRTRSSDSNCRQIGGQQLGFLEFGFVSDFGTEEDALKTMLGGREPNIEGTDIRCGEIDLSEMFTDGSFSQVCALARGTAGANVSETRAQESDEGIDREYLAKLLDAWAGAIPRLK